MSAPNATPKPQLPALFTDEERNALMLALHRAAACVTEDHLTPEGRVYHYLEETPKTSLVSELVTELHRLGYCIRHKEDA